MPLCLYGCRSLKDILIFNLQVLNVEVVKGRDALVKSVTDVWDRETKETFKEKLSKIRRYDRQFWPHLSLDANLQIPELTGPCTHNVLRAQRVKVLKDSDVKAKTDAGGKVLPRKENIQNNSAGVKTAKVDLKVPSTSSMPISKLGNMVSTNALCTSFLD